MSIGGCYILVKKDELENALSLSNNLNAFVKDKEHFTLEQAWDAIRVLTIDYITNIFGETILDCHIGETCFYINSEEINLMQIEFNNISEDVLKEVYHSEKYNREEFYYDNYYKDDEESEKELYDYVIFLKNFIQKINTQEYNLLFYIN